MRLTGEAESDASDFVFLNVCYRLPPAICETTSSSFYNGQLTSGWKERDIVFQHPVLFVETPPEDLPDSDADKRKSPYEASVVATIMKYLVEFGVPANRCLAITPYDKQRQQLKEACADSMGATPQESGLLVDTPDSCQGGERDVVIMSQALQSRYRPVPEFIADLRRVNVAS